MKLSLRPYPGTVIICETLEQLLHKVSRADKKPFTMDDGLSVGGYTVQVLSETVPVRYFVWAEDTPSLAHELSHVVLWVFEIAGIDAREAGGEPFCYMLGQLMKEALQ